MKEIMRLNLAYKKLHQQVLDMINDLGDKALVWIHGVFAVTIALPAIALLGTLGVYLAFCGLKIAARLLCIGNIFLFCGLILLI